MDELEIVKAPLGSGPSDESPAVRPLPVETPPPPGSSRPALRRRLGAIASLAAVLLAGTLVATATPGSRGALRSLLRLPTPTASPTLPFGSDYVYFEHAAPWAGPPLLDGTPLPQNTGNSPSLPLPVRVTSRGRHTLDYAAAPFPALHCRFTVPAAKDDTCPLGSQADLSLPGTVKLARVLDLGAVASRLPADQLAALYRAVHAAADQPDATAQMLPGEHYRTTDGIQVAGEPLTATLSFGVRPDPTSTCDGSAACGYVCGAICVEADGNNGGTGENGSWLVQVRIGGSWRYTARDGRVVANNVPSQPIDGGGFVQGESRYLYARWANGWMVDGGPNSSVPSQWPPLCVAFDSLSIQPVGKEGAYYSTVSADNPADGCLYIALSQAAGAGQQRAIAYTVLFRFGVLLAADDAAHGAHPDLPVADAHERAIAQQALAAYRAALNQQGQP